MIATNIEGKVVIITGASSGLGESTARHLANLGATVVIAARRKDRLDKIAREIQTKGGKALAVAADVSRQSDVDALIQKSLDAFGKIDVLINNSGVMPIAPLALRKGRSATSETLARLCGSRMTRTGKTRLPS